MNCIAIGLSLIFHAIFGTYSRQMVHKCEIRVRYSDTDQMQRLHHGAYVDYLEVARIEMLRDLGISYAQLEERGYALPVIRLNIEYLGAASYDEIVTFKTKVQCTGPVRMRFDYELYVNGETIARAIVELACINIETFRPTRMPVELVAQLREVSS